MNHLAFPVDDNVLVGTATADDAGVYRVSEDLALIQTVDFFTPIVDDPYQFGRIAAANSLSDVYAMGGVPKTAMNIVAFPMQTMGKEVLREILAGSADNLKKANTSLLGGHSVEDDELKYGLSVTGFIHPERFLKNQGLKQGDHIILTKPIGTGIINTAIKCGLVDEKTVSKVTDSMATLNRLPAEIIKDYPISACTDVTGFGLLGHLAEMIANTQSKITIDTSKVPILERAYEFAAMGFVPIGAHKNRDHKKDMVTMEATFDPVLRDILFDPQTSGGLLFGCCEEKSDNLIQQLVDRGIEQSAIIGEVTKADNSMILIK